MTGAPSSAAHLPSPLLPSQARAIATAFLPESRWGNRSRYYYVQAKLRSDPLYHGVLQALPTDALPVLDLGCGLGLLGHVMRLQGHAQGYVGVDVDAGKIRHARHALCRAGLVDARVDPLDLRSPLPAHCGHVAVLDVLHYLDAPSQTLLLRAATARVAAGGRLLLRTPLDTGDGRDRTTRLTDRLGWLSGWMRTRPRHYPRPEALTAILVEAGLEVERPRALHGRTPFNSWLLVAKRPAG